MRFNRDYSDYSAGRRAERRGPIAADRSKPQQDTDETRERPHRESSVDEGCQPHHWPRFPESMS